MANLSNWAKALGSESPTLNLTLRLVDEAQIVARWTTMAKRLLKCRNAAVGRDNSVFGQHASRAEGDPSAPIGGSSIMAVSIPMSRTDEASQLFVSDDQNRVWSSVDVATLCDIAAAVSLEINIAYERHEHRLLQEQLRFSEEIHRALAEASSQIIWVSDASGGMVEPCTTWQEFTGQTAKEVVGFGCLNAIHPDDQEWLRQMWDRASRAPGRMNFEYRLRHNTGKWRWVSECAIPLLTSEGKLTGWAGISVDVHDRKLEQQRLQQSEIRFRALVEASSQIVWTTDAGGTVAEDSPSWRAFTGQSEADWLSDGRIAVVHPDDLTIANHHLRSAAQASESSEAEYRLRNASGQWRWMLERAVPYGGAHGRHEGWVGMVVDITDRKLAELELAGRERHLSLALKAARMAAWSFDYANDELTVEGGVETLSSLHGAGNRLEALLDKMSRVDGEKFRTSICSAKQFDQALNIEFQLGQPDAPIWISAEGHKTVDKAGHAVLLRGIFHDITDRRMVEERRNLLIGEIAHRGKNLLAVVQSIASITLAGNTASESSHRKFLDRLASLSRSHSLLTDKDWLGVPLDELVKLEFGQLTDRVSIDVAPVILNPSAAQNCSLVLHELITNSLKYGALSVVEGRVAVSGHVAKGEEEDCVMFRWKESGGPIVNPPTRLGFGSMLLRRLIDGFDTPGCIDFEPDGLSVRVAMPLSMIRPTAESVSYNFRGMTH